MSETRAFVPGEYEELKADLSDPTLQDASKKLFAGLHARLGLAGATSVMYLGVIEGFFRALHTESPMPEANIASMHNLIDKLRELVKEHEDCAINLTAKLAAGGEPIIEKKEVVH